MSGGQWWLELQEVDEVCDSLDFGVEGILLSGGQTAVGETGHLGAEIFQVIREEAILFGKPVGGTDGDVVSAVLFLGQFVDGSDEYGVEVRSAEVAGELANGFARSGLGHPVELS
jgi:hypothetical protein